MAIQKLYYSITEVSKILNEEQHVLRYWEREFPQLKPQKNRAGNRVYTQRDLQVLRLIKKLLRNERYTVAGAKDHLRQHGAFDSSDAMLDEMIAADTISAEDTPVPDVHERDERAQTVVNELRTLAADLLKPARVGH